MIEFVWDDDNEEHVGKHGVTPAEAEHVVYNAARPWPMYKGRGTTSGSSRAGGRGTEWFK